MADNVYFGESKRRDDSAPAGNYGREPRESRESYDAPRRDSYGSSRADSGYGGRQSSGASAFSELEDDDGDLPF